MFDSVISSGQHDTSREALVTLDGIVSWNQFPPVIDRLQDELAYLARSRVALQLRPSATCLAILAVLDRLNCDAILLSSELSIDEAKSLVEPLDTIAVIREFASDNSFESWPKYQVHRTDHDRQEGGESGVTILTSGTSGRPKAVRHNWDSLSRPVRRGADIVHPRWLLSYAPHLYAGLQVILQSLINGGCLVAPPMGSAPDEVIQLMSQGKVEYASATPSYWRRLLLFGNRPFLAKVPLRVVTLGGESVDQTILDQLKLLFPAARLVHIYATTELGRCFSVTDGQDGFPAAYFEQISADGVEMRIDDGELSVRSANRMRGYVDRPEIEVDDWIATGDLVEVRGDRAHFVGRKSETINVGGNKVHPLEVERVIRAVRGVVDVRVYGQSSSIAGELVGCEIVAADDSDGESVRHEVATTCTDHLTDFQRPRVIKLVPAVSLSAAGKIKRALDQQQ